MNITVIVPSLDPDEKLMQVVEGLLRVGFTDILLVNDGSHDDHVQPFLEAAQHPEVTVLTHEVNKGKGRALKTAFEWCLRNRPDLAGVVTADGDNQHKAEDILRCARQLLQFPDKVWLGVRDFSLEHVPFRSRFGNTLTRGIMRLAAGVAVTDTQTGLRAIPAAALPLMLEVAGERYEYETEMLMSLHDNHWGIGEVVIETVYIDENQTSHFNPRRDSWKIYKIIFRHMFRSLGTLLRYGASALFSVLVDQGLFALLNMVVLSSLTDGKRVLWSTAVARVVSSLVNYATNARLVFRQKSLGAGTFLRYYTLCFVQLTLSFVMVLFFTRLFHTSGWGDSLVKILVDTLLFFVNFSFQKNWVFKEK